MSSRRIRGTSPVIRVTESQSRGSSSSDGGNSVATQPAPQSKSSIHLSAFNSNLKKYASSPSLQMGPSLSNFEAQVSPNESLQVPIVGYEVMEQRARFTVYKLRIENKARGDCWFVFRRYTDFVRIHSKLKAEFPHIDLPLPRKRWFGDNFNRGFIEERIQGLQKLINSIVASTELMNTPSIRDFFCLDEPPIYSDCVEESRAIFEALEDTIYNLRQQVREKNAELKKANQKYEKQVALMSDFIGNVRTTTDPCNTCCDKVQALCTDYKNRLHEAQSTRMSSYNT
ncbi:hypothetical protein M8J77_002239 [Diaphorina citri]|nr:hypothetical protein M8J77_002239 [Diaphorina citri]